MNYVIVNNKDLCIRLNKTGCPEICSRNNAQSFESSKAKNILDNLPKTFKKFNFRVEPIPDAIFTDTNKNIENSTLENTTIKKRKQLKSGNSYEVSEDIISWVDRFGLCYDTLDEANEKVKTLIKILEKSDDELLDILHIIEIEPPKDLYGGWLLYKRIRENRKKRRSIKDEIMIIENVLENIDRTYLNRDRIRKAIDGLFKRKYRFRIIEEEENSDL